ncbi:ABC transporter substrate-binding protein [Ciceribacter thiooxidans]|uniref:ABC transporter substrate-binding protein n=1 Tax=Ciceribacter thiooxidans TaxID=1969821 RepID=A0ABV7I897_9HYPH|nr:ABC transporter substrate-binding protein [Ciceribacter thiooxidans]
MTGLRHAVIRLGAVHHLVGMLAAMLFTLLSALAAEAEIITTDLKGREVHLREPARRLAVDDARTIIALSFTGTEAPALVAAWPHDVARIGEDLYQAYRARFPQIDGLPQIASNQQNLSVEEIAAAEPDLVVLSLYSHVTPEQVTQIEMLGIPVAYVDFTLDPLAHTGESIRLLGRLTGNEAAADAFADFRDGEIAGLVARVDEVAAAGSPTVFMETHASTTEACCNSPGTENFGRILALLKARNIGDILKGRPFGQVSTEHVISSGPEVYIATGGPYMEKRNGLLIGPSYDAETTEASLLRLLSRPGFSSLPAVASGRVHGMSSQLLAPGFDLLAMQLMAAWCYPQAFTDFDAGQALEELNARTAVPLEGIYWTK